MLCFEVTSTGGELPNTNCNVCTMLCQMIANGLPEFEADMTPDRTASTFVAKVPVFVTGSAANSSVAASSRLSCNGCYDPITNTRFWGKQRVAGLWKYRVPEYNIAHGWLTWVCVCLCASLHTACHRQPVAVGLYVSHLMALPATAAPTCLATRDYRH